MNMTNRNDEMADLLAQAQTMHEKYGELLHEALLERARAASPEEYASMIAQMVTRWTGGKTTAVEQGAGWVKTWMTGGGPSRAGSTVLVTAAQKREDLPGQGEGNIVGAALDTANQSRDGWVVICCPDHFSESDWQASKAQNDRVVILLGGPNLAETMTTYSAGAFDKTTLRFSAVDLNALQKTDVAPT